MFVLSTFVTSFVKEKRMRDILLLRQLR